MSPGLIGNDMANKPLILIDASLTLIVAAQVAGMRRCEHRFAMLKRNTARQCDPTWQEGELNLAGCEALGISVSSERTMFLRLPGGATLRLAHEKTKVAHVAARQLCSCPMRGIRIRSWHRQSGHPCDTSTVSSAVAAHSGQPAGYAAPHRPGRSGIATTSVTCWQRMLADEARETRMIGGRLWICRGANSSHGCSPRRDGHTL